MLAPGDYYVRTIFEKGPLKIPVATANIDGEEFSYSSRVEVYVGDGGSERVDLVLRPSAEVRGRVIFEGELSGVRVLANGFEGDGRNQLRPQVGDIKLALNRKDGLPLGASGLSAARIAADTRSFSIRDVPEGDYELSASIESDGRPPGVSHYISDVRLGGKSVFDTGFRVGLDPEAFILVPEFFRRSNASLYRVLYLPRNAEFKTNGVAPGNYKLFAVPYLNETVPYRSPEFLSRHESRAVSVTVEKGRTVEGVQAPFLSPGR